MNKLMQSVNLVNKHENVQRAVTLAKRMLVDSIWKAANVEGLGTTFPNTEAILENLPVNTKRDEVLFVLNMRDAWRFIIDNLDYNDCLMFIRELNKIAGRDLIYGCGVLRKSDVSIGGTSWKPSIPYEDDVYESISKINRIEDKVEKALEYFCYLSRAQLFVDGNKRVAQLMANKILIEEGIGILAIPVEEVVTFKTILVDFYESNEADRLKEFLRTKCLQFI